MELMLRFAFVQLRAHAINKKVDSECSDSDAQTRKGETELVGEHGVVSKRVILLEEVARTRHRGQISSEQLDSLIASSGDQRLACMIRGDDYTALIIDPKKWVHNSSRATPTLSWPNLLRSAFRNCHPQCQPYLVTCPERQVNLTRMNVNDVH